MNPTPERRIATPAVPIPGILLAGALFAACGDSAAGTASLEPVQGGLLTAPVESAPEAGTAADATQAQEAERLARALGAGPKAGDIEDGEANGPREIAFIDLMLDDEIKEDLLDALIYPEEYDDEDRAFPPEIARFDGQEVAISGYMIPVAWEETKVTELMLVGDMLSCCFGGAPEPDEWIDVTMAGSYQAEYYPFVPVVLTGTFSIAGIEDDAGYAAGAYHIVATSLEKEL